MITGASPGLWHSVMVTPFGHTADCFEKHLGTIHLGYFERTGPLLPTLVAARRPHSAHGAATQVLGGGQRRVGRAERGIHLSDCRIRTAARYAVDEPHALLQRVCRSASACRGRRV